MKLDNNIRIQIYQYILYFLSLFGNMMNQKQPSNINGARLLFFISQILYQSSDYCQRISVNSSSIDMGTNNQNVVGTDQFWIGKLMQMVPFQISTLLIIAFTIISLYGLMQLILLKKASLMLQFVQLLGFPISYILTTVSSTQEIVTARFVVFRILPLIIITSATYIKIVFVIQVHSTPYEAYNQFKKCNHHYPILSLLRIVFISILSQLTSINFTILIYFLVAFQLISTFYKGFTIVYYSPQAEWCTTLSEIWGWVSIGGVVMRQNGLGGGLFGGFIIFAVVLVLSYAYFVPNSKIVVLLQYKIQRILQKCKKQRKNQYFIYVAIYYVDIHAISPNRFLRQCWSNSFKLLIKIKLMDKQYKITEYFAQIQKTKTLKSIKNLSQAQIGTQAQIQIQQKSQIEKMRQKKQEERKNIQKLENFIREKGIFQGSGKYDFQSTYYLGFLMIDIELVKDVNVYEIYYQLLIKEDQRNNIFFQIGMTTLSKFLNLKVSAKQYTGTYIQQILKYDYFHNLLEKYISNEQKYFSLTNQADIDLSKYKTYLDKKIGLKSQIKKTLKILQFLYPNSQCLLMKNYIIQRYIDNNQFLSQEYLVHRMAKINSKKTKIINFSQNLLNNQFSICLTSFIKNKGYIVHFNKNFQKNFEVRGSLNNILKIKDIIPSYWRDVHEEKLQHMDKFQDNYQHGQQNIYYVQSLENHKYMEARQLKVIPYFQLNTSIYFLTKMKIDRQKELSIIVNAKQRKADSLNVMKTRIKNKNKTIISSMGNQRMKQSLNNKKGDRNNGQNLTTQKKMNLSKNPQFSSLISDKNNKIRSKHHIAFKHEIFDDEDHNTIDQSEKIIQIFNTEYLVCMRTKCQNFYTRNLLEEISSRQEQLGQQINEIIKMGLDKKFWQCEVLQKSKNKIDLFDDTKKQTLTKIGILSLFLLIGIFAIGTSFGIYNSLVSKSVLFQFRYRQAFISSVYFQSILIKVSQNYLWDSSNKEFPVLIDYDKKIVQDIYDDYIQFINSLIFVDSFQEEISVQHQTFDYGLYQKSGQFTLIDHFIQFNTLLDSSNAALGHEIKSLIQAKENQISNKTTNRKWIVNHFQQVLASLQNLYPNNQYIQNVVVRQIKKSLFEQISQAEYIFWVGLALILIAGILSVIMFYRFNQQIQRVLCKPLLMTQKQRYIFKANYKSIQQYLQKEKQTEQKKAEQSETMYAMSSKSIMNMTNQMLQETNEPTHQLQQKQLKNKFINHTLFYICIVIFFGIVVFVSTKYLYLAKSEYIIKLELQLNAFKIFSDLNKNVYQIYTKMLDTFLNGVDSIQKREFMDFINEKKKQINQVDVSETLSAMLINSSLTTQVLFGDPCTWSKICQMFPKQKINSYPVELNLFLFNFYKFESLISKQVSKISQIQTLIYESYFSMRSLAEMSHWVCTLNYNSINQRMQQEQLWLSLGYAFSFAFCAFIILEILRLYFIERRYGREVLAILMSSAICQSKLWSYQVNSVLYRTNFAKDLPHI